MEDGYRIWIDRSGSQFGVDIRIGLVRDGKPYIAEPITLIFKPHVSGERIMPTLELPDQEGLAFLDALKLALNEHHGIREGHVEGELKATKSHLRDMKLLLWKKMGIDDWAEKPQIEIQSRR